MNEELAENMAHLLTEVADLNQKLTFRDGPIYDAINVIDRCRDRLNDLEIALTEEQRKKQGAS